MRKATEREREFFRRVEKHPAFQLITALCAIFGFTVLTGFVITGGSGVINVLRTVALVLVGMSAGYGLCAIRNYE